MLVRPTVCQLTSSAQSECVRVGKPSNIADGSINASGVEDLQDGREEGVSNANRDEATVDSLRKQ